MQETLPERTSWQTVVLPFSKLSTSFVSGVQDKNRIEISYFQAAGDTSRLFAEICYGDYAAGPPGHAHGGAQAAVLDELCGGIVWLQNHKALAVKLETEFLQMIPLGESLTGIATVLNTDRRKVYTEASIVNEQGVVLAKAKTLFVKLTEDQLKNLAIYQK